MKERLKVEFRYRQLKQGLARGEELANSASLFRILDAVPCVLHMENRVGLKTLTMLLTEGLSNAKKGTIYTADFPNSVSK